MLCRARFSRGQTQAPKKPLCAPGPKKGRAQGPVGPIIPSVWLIIAAVIAFLAAVIVFLAAASVFLAAASVFAAPGPRAQGPRSQGPGAQRPRGGPGRPRKSPGMAQEGRGRAQSRPRAQGGDAPLMSRQRWDPRRPTFGSYFFNFF